MTPAIPYLLDLGRMLVEGFVWLFVRLLIAGAVCFGVGVLCGLVWVSKDVPAWVKALAEKHAPQAKPEPEKVTVPAGITSNPRWPAGARH